MGACITTKVLCISSRGTPSENTQMTYAAAALPSIRQQSSGCIAYLQNFRKNKSFEGLCHFLNRPSKHSQRLLSWQSKLGQAKPGFGKFRDRTTKFRWRRNPMCDCGCPTQGSCWWRRHLYCERHGFDQSRESRCKKERTICLWLYAQSTAWTHNVRQLYAKISICSDKPQRAKSQRTG